MAFAERQWQKAGPGPHHGWALPLFSLWTEQSCGIGEYLDLLPCLDWCKELGFNVLQLLPLNDKGLEPSPYNPLSSCALDPSFLSLAPLAKESGLSLEAFAPFRLFPRVAKREIAREKLRWLSLYYEKMGKKITASPEYRSFLDRHPWVFRYALFKSLKLHYGGKHWSDWPKEAHNPSEALYREFREPITFHSLVQYLCFSQMESVKAYADQKEMLLMGDIPILLSPDSVDVWSFPSLFELDLSAGAPPDLYNALGQKWGFPLFNWRAMEKEGYRWWRERLQCAETLYHLYRIDHAVGFFRIWAIPLDKEPSEGFFVPADSSVWIEEGTRRLAAFLEASNMLPIAEDLGTVPEEVRTTLRKLGICTTHVLRWERRWTEDQSFLPYGEYPSFGLSTVSTHDTPLVREWWRAFPEEAKSFCTFRGWNYTPELSSERLFAILQDSHKTPCRFHINLLQEYLCLFDDLISTPEEERINIPGTLLPTNWTGKLRLSLEDLRAHGPLNQALLAIFKETP